MGLADRVADEVAGGVADLRHDQQRDEPCHPPQGVDVMQPGERQDMVKCSLKLGIYLRTVVINRKIISVTIQALRELPHLEANCE